MTDKIKTAVIGVGHLGQAHARIHASLEQTELAAVCDINETNGRAIAERHGTRFVRDYRELLDKVEAVSVATPTVNHHEITCAFLEAGVHVLVEKPIARTLDEADGMIRLAESKNLVLQAGHIERFNPAFVALRRHITRPRFFEAHRMGIFTPRSLDIDVVMDLMVHELDIIASLVKSDVVKLDAVGIPILTPKIDLANARLEFANGCIANITASRVSPDRVRKIRIFQDDAYISLDYNAQQAEVYRRQAGRIVSEILQTERGEPLKLEIGSFVESVRLGGRPQVPAEHGLSALRLAGEILASIDRERKKIARLREKALQGW